jgi:hypothetical protein
VASVVQVEPEEALERSVQMWEEAYRQFGHASVMSARAAKSDKSAAWQFAEASRAVSPTWRQIAVVGDLPWWTLAAVESAAQAFEGQAREWEARREIELVPDGSPAGRGSWSE